MNQQRKLALSMRGGSAKTVAYLGVVNYLEDHNIHIDMMIGASGGAMIATTYAYTLDAKAISKHCSTFNPKQMWDLDSILKLDIFDRERMMNWGGALVGDGRLEDLPITTWVQVTNLDKLKSEIIDHGRIKDTCSASCAFPFLTEPLEIEGVRYLDGDISSGYAVKFLKDKGAEVVIGLNSGHPGSTGHYLSDKFFLSLAAAKSEILRLDQEKDPVDLMLSDLGAEIGALEFSASRDAFEHGYRIAREHSEEIMDLLYR